jgi:aryl-alcohol dehydrogenase-like predicted oxidoreductase
MRLPPGQPLTAFYVDSSPEYCKEAIETSLKRLQTTYIDLYYVHRLDKITSIEKTMGALVELKEAGKIKHLGLSSVSAKSLRRAQAVHPVAAVQMEYNMFNTEIESAETEVLKTARELGIAIIAFSPLGRGLLGGKWPK